MINSMVSKMILRHNLMNDKVRDQGHKIVAKDQKYIIFLEIVQIVHFFYQNLMGNPKSNKKCKFPSILAATHNLL